jgi:hypothetical protein
MQACELPQEPTGLRAGSCDRCTARCLQSSFPQHSLHLPRNSSIASKIRRTIPLAPFRVECAGSCKAASGSSVSADRTDKKTRRGVSFRRVPQIVYLLISTSEEVEENCTAPQNPNLFTFAHHWAQQHIVSTRPSSPPKEDCRGRTPAGLSEIEQNCSDERPRGQQ